MGFGLENASVVVVECLEDEAQRGNVSAEREVNEGEGTRETGKTVGLETYQFV